MKPDAQFSGTDGGTPPTATTENNPALINDATGGGTTEGNYDLASSKFSTSEMEFWATVLTPRSWRWHSASIVLP